MPEVIWYEDLKHFITEHNFFKILPQHYMNLEGKINAVVRFCLYLSILLTLIMVDYRYLFIGIVACVVSIVVYEYERRKKEQQDAFMDAKGVQVVDDKLCAKPSVNNPFMNVLINDIQDNPHRPPACNVANDGNKALVASKFHARMFRDVNDIYDNMASQRQYYTTASTTIPNDQGAFAEWLYGRPASCKQGNGEQCMNNIYSSLNR